MRIVTLSCLSLLALSAGANPAVPPAPAENIGIRFSHPEKFTDATYQNRESSREQVTRDLATYLAATAARYLPSGQRLDLEITDIDLAGRYEPWQTHAPDIRFMRDTTWPRIQLGYRLYANGQEIAKGEETVSDMQYLQRPGLHGGNDPLRHEKAMLDDWLRSRFDPASPQAVVRRPL